MEEMSLIQKFGVLFDNFVKHPLFFVIFIIPIIMFFLSKKHGKKIYIIIYFISVITVLLLGGNEIFKLFDNLMDAVFMTLYFPNFITLFIVVILNAIISLISLINKKINKLNKIINYTSFIIIQSLFALILVIVKSNKINIYKESALYSNSDILAIMQILIGTFAIEMSAIIIIYLIKKVTSVLDKKENLSKSIENQIEHLKKTKIKTINIDNEKIGYINVADRQNSSIPILKPFKFNIDKIESIKLNVTEKPKMIKEMQIEDKTIKYLNEVPKKIKNIDIYNKDATYLNEIPSKIKILTIDNNKAINLETVEELFDITQSNPIIKKIDLNTNKYVYLNVKPKNIKLKDINIKSLTYLKEIIKPKHFKISKINSEKLTHLNVKSKSYSLIKLENQDFTYFKEIPKSNHKYTDVELKDKDVRYLKEVIKPKKLKIIELDSNKINSIKIKYTSQKQHKPLINEKPKNINIPDEGLLKGTSYNNDFDRLLTSKPDLLKPIEQSEKEEKTGQKEKKLTAEKATVNLIENLRIIDVQSTLDAVVKCNLMKDAKIKSYTQDITVNKLKICNMELVIKIIKKYVIIKNR